MLVGARSAEAAEFGFLEDFSGPGTENWGRGTGVSNPGTGGADGDVDSGDFAVFQRCISGTNVPADPGCVE